MSNSRNFKHWTEEEIQYLKENLVRRKRGCVAEIAKHLGRTECSVFARKKKELSVKYLDMVCYMCGESFKTISCAKPKTYCSEKCRKRRNSDYTKDRFEKIKQFKLYYGCKLCGYKKSIRSLTFHHIYSKDKDFLITKTKLNTEGMIEELNKCALLCFNCHGEIHDLIHSDYDRYLEEIVPLFDLKMGFEFINYLKNQEDGEKAVKKIKMLPLIPPPFIAVSFRNE